MPLLIVPWTSPKHKKLIIEQLNAELFISDFWASNFRSYSNVPLVANPTFKAKIGDRELLIVAAGYGEQNMEYGIHLYLKKFNDPRRMIYFLGSCFAIKNSKLELGSIIIPDACDGGGVVARYYRKKALETNPTKDPRKFDENLVKRLRRISREYGIPTYSGKVFCAPLDVGYEWGEFYEKGYKKGYVAGELESASIVAIANCYNIPSAAILSVKDKGNPGQRKEFLEFKRSTDYKVIKSEDRMKALKEQLKLVELSLCTF